MNNLFWILLSFFWIIFELMLQLMQQSVPFSSCITVFPEKPYQLQSFKFATSTFGNDPKEFLFKPQWYQKYPWLHYDVRLDKIFFHTCIKAIKLGNISATKYEEAFTNAGFSTGRKHQKKKSGLAKHNDSNSHKKASEDLLKASDYGTNDVGELLDNQIITTAAKN